mmetsp:Transcript_1620/g.2142  ORF Transcript_1620/g.2142 Transcript_1620/m.2142 type:complete len:125 (-) Transcript_1620:1210-1584(-)
MAQQQIEPMTVERARVILKDTIQTFSLPENRSRLEAAVHEAQQAPPEQQQLIKMQKLVPLITSIAGQKLQQYQIPNVMVGIMQLQSVAAQDKLVFEGIQLLTMSSMGNPPSDSTIASYLERLGE